jgi:metal-sulfur cluster biosynthetic enzyme|tara:strand:- start:12384 stop:12716 length:333 start_codon:yes stop_codon:yes gene_type:complete
MEIIKEEIIKRLREVYDPEISINIYDLGLVYEINIDAFPKVVLTHTLTSAFCPAADWIIKEINKAVVNAPGVTECEVVTTFEPPFDMSMVSEEVKMAMGWEDEVDQWEPY